MFVGDNDEFIGFLTSWEWNDFRYGEHFAISPEMRCGGIGGNALRWFLASDSRPLVIEVEPPTDEMACRRIGFYERNGLRLWNDVEYVQPPYSPDRHAIELKLMTYGGDFAFCRRQICEAYTSRCLWSEVEDETYTNDAYMLRCRHDGGMRRQGWSKPTLMVSIPPQKYVLERIAGDKWAVGSMIEKATSAESYDPDMSQMMDLENCRAYLS